MLFPLPRSYLKITENFGLYLWQIVVAKPSVLAGGQNRRQARIDPATFSWIQAPSFQSALFSELLATPRREQNTMPASDHRLTTAEMAEFVANGYLRFDGLVPDAQQESTNRADRPLPRKGKNAVRASGLNPRPAEFPRLKKA